MRTANFISRQAEDHPKLTRRHVHFSTGPFHCHTAQLSWLALKVCIVFRIWHISESASTSQPSQPQPLAAMRHGPSMRLSVPQTPLATDKATPLRRQLLTHSSAATSSPGCVGCSAMDSFSAFGNVAGWFSDGTIGTRDT